MPFLLTKSHSEWEGGLENPQKHAYVHIEWSLSVLLIKDPRKCAQFDILFSRMHSRCPLMYEWNKNKYYGAAHGLVGILFVLLQAGEKYFIEDAMKNNVKGSIDYLRSKLYPSGNVPQSHSSNSDKLVRWCHGAPGAIHLFILASHSVKFGHFYLIITVLQM